jgi:hypothetical protein
MSRGSAKERDVFSAATRRPVSSSHFPPSPPVHFLLKVPFVYRAPLGPKRNICISLLISISHVSTSMCCFLVHLDHSDEPREGTRAGGAITQWPRKVERQDE